MIQAVRILILLIALGIISSCGGGGGGAAVEPDSTPDQFRFTDRIEVPLATDIESEAIVIRGITVPVTASISGGEYSINGGPYTSANGSLNAGDNVRVRVRSAAQPDTSLSATLTVSGVSDDFDVRTMPDSTPPSATLLFPPPRSLTTADSVALRGTSVDEWSEIVAVRVNGALAETTDEYANWTARVNLVHGENTVLIETEDELQNIDAEAAVAAVFQEKFPFDSPFGIAVDSDSDTAFLTASYVEIPPDYTLSRGVFSIDLQTSERSLLSHPGGPGSGAAISSAGAIAVDSARNRVLVVDGSFDSIVAVDSSSGDRTILSDSTTPDSTNLLSHVTGIAIDISRNRALVSDNGRHAILAVDLDSGARTVLSDNQVPSADVPVINPWGIALDMAGDRAIVSSSTYGSLLSVDLETGSRFVLSNNVIPDGDNPLQSPKGLAMDGANGRVLVTDDAADTLFSVDIATGARSVLSDNETPGTGPILDSFQYVAVDADNNRALLSDGTHSAVLAVDLDSGAASLLSGYHTLSLRTPMGRPDAIAFDYARNRYLVTDRARNAVYALDFNNGQRTVISGRHPGGTDIPDSEFTFLEPESIHIDVARNRAIVLDIDRRALYTVHLDTGQRAVLSGTDLPNSDNAFSLPRDAAWDEDTDKIYVSNPGNDSIIVVDGETGIRTVLSDIDTPNGGIPLAEPRQIAIDHSRNRLLVTDMNSLIAIDIESGQRSLLASDLWTIPNQTSWANGLAVDPTRDRALVAVNTLDRRVIAVDLETGAATVLSRSDTDNPDTPLFGIGDIVVETVTGRILVTDFSGLVPGLYELHPETGERVGISVN